MNALWRCVCRIYLLLGFCVVLYFSIVQDSALAARVLLQKPHHLLVEVGEYENLLSLAERYLGDRGRAWQIAQYNGINVHVDGVFERNLAGQTLLIPMGETEVRGVRYDGFEGVSILCYHRFSGGSSSRMTIPSALFEQQMRYLKVQGYRVLSLHELVSFLEQKKPIAPKSVILTIDDGHRSVYEYAYPILKRYEFVANLFLYSDYIGRGGLNWSQLEEMSSSGLVSLHAHSKSHDNLALLMQDESVQDYRARVAEEVRVPADLIRQRLKFDAFGFAYPYGDVSSELLEVVKQQNYRLGFTVLRGTNSAFSSPLLLKRILVYGDESLDKFKKALSSFESLDLSTVLPDSREQWEQSVFKQ